MKPRQRRGVRHRARILEARREMLAAAPEWLTREQAALIGRVTTRTIDRWRQLGRLRSYTYSRELVGRRPVLVSREDLRGLLALEEMPTGGVSG